MAEPTQFPEQNFIYRKPEGMTDDQCGDLPCIKHGNTVISKWKLSPEELAEINETGCVWLMVLGTPPPPIAVFVPKSGRFESFLKICMQRA